MGKISQLLIFKHVMINVLILSLDVQRTAVVHIDGPEPKSQSNDEVAYSQTLKNPGLEFEHDVRSSYVPRSRSQTPFEGV